MCMRRQHDRLDLLQQRRHAQAHFRPDAQRQCVDEEADQRLQFAARTIRHRRADHHIVLPAEAAQQTRPARQQGHEQRRTVTLAQLPQPCRQCRAQGQAHPSAGITAQRWAAVVGWQLQQGRCAAQVLPPKVDLHLQGFALQPLPLPRGVVDILEGQCRQRISQPLAEGAVQHTDFVQQNARRPTVRNDMVLGHQQDVLHLRQLHKPPANQRTARQVEWRQRLLASELLYGLVLRLMLRRAVQRAQVMSDQGEPLSRRRDHLDRLALVQGKVGAQGFVARHDPVQRGLQGVSVQSATQP